MNSKSLLALILLTLLGVGGYYISSQQNSINRSASIGEVLLADVLPHVNSIEKITITGADNTTVVTLHKQGGTWQVAERDNYPAEIATIRSLVVALLEARMLEEKTSNPDLYARLGVEAISHADAQGMQVTLYYADQSAALIIGNPGPQLNKNRYVRQPDAATTWLVDQKIEVKHELTYWLEKDLFSIEPEQITRVAVTVADSATMLIEHQHDTNTPEGSHFKVTNLSDPGAQVVDAELQQISNALSSFQLLDVATRDIIAGHSASLNIEYQLNDGSVIALEAYDLDGQRYAVINVSGPAEFVTRVQEKSQGRVFKLPNVSYEAMFKREEDVLVITEDMLN